MLYYNSAKPNESELQIKRSPMPCESEDARGDYDGNNGI